MLLRGGRQKRLRYPLSDRRLEEQPSEFVRARSRRHAALTWDGKGDDYLSGRNEHLAELRQWMVKRDRKLDE